jgi:hypothetical protein
MNAFCADRNKRNCDAARVLVAGKSRYRTLEFLWRGTDPALR